MPTTPASEAPVGSARSIGLLVARLLSRTGARKQNDPSYCDRCRSGKCRECARRIRIEASLRDKRAHFASCPNRPAAVDLASSSVAASAMRHQLRGNRGGPPGRRLPCGWACGAFGSFRHRLKCSGISLAVSLDFRGGNRGLRGVPFRSGALPTVSSSSESLGSSAFSACRACQADANSASRSSDSVRCGSLTFPGI